MRWNDRMISSEFISQYSGLCPFCELFIAKNHSPIVMLQWPWDQGVWIRTEDGRRSLDTGKFYYWDGRSVQRRRKRAIHVHCIKTLKRLVESEEIWDWIEYDCPW